MTKDEQIQLAEVSTDVKWVRGSLEILTTTNKEEHSEIQKHLLKINNTAKTNRDAVFSPDAPGDGLVNRVRKLEKLYWRLFISCSILAFIIGSVGTQWLEEILRDTPFTIPHWLGYTVSIFGG